MFGLGKPRTVFGAWVDRQGYSQADMVAITGISRNTVGSMCNDPDYDPYNETKIKVISCLRKEGHNVYVSDFWRE